MTQGPWHVAHKPDGEYPVFDIGHRQPNGDVDYIGEIADAGDARMAASAPELWSALATIVTTFDILEDKPDVAKALMPLGGMIDKARKVLAKASGDEEWNI